MRLSRQLHYLASVLALAILFLLGKRVQVMQNNARSHGHVVVKILGRTWLSAFSGRLSPQFIVPIFSEEQLINQLGNFMDLCRLALDWDGSLVEPFVCGSRLYGLPNFRDDHCSRELIMAPYNSFYDLQELNDSLHCANGCSIRPWSDFVKKSYRKLYIILMLKGYTYISLLKKRQSIGDMNLKLLMDCTKEFSSFAQNVTLALNAEANKFSVPLFRVIGIVCWDRTATISTRQLMLHMNSGLSHEDQNKFSVLFDRYASRQDSGNIYRPQIVSSKQVLKTDFCSKLAIGPTLVKHYKELAKSFVESLGMKFGSYISVHIRIEKMVKNFSDWKIKCCMENLKKSLLQLKGDTKILLITDISPSGTDSCDQDNTNCIRKSKQIKDSLKTVVGVNAEYFDPTKYGHDMLGNSIAGAVESEALCRGNKLLVAGSGAFQAKIIHRFFEYKYALTGPPLTPKFGNYTEGGEIEPDVYTFCRTPLQDLDTFYMDRILADNSC